MNVASDLFIANCPEREGPEVRLDLAKAVRSNPRYARLVGWGSRYPQIAELLQFSASSPGPEQFAIAVEEWQRRHPLLVPSLIAFPGATPWRQRMNIDEQAPARSTREIRIEAPTEVVWGLIVDVENWPAWNRPVSRVQLDGPFAPGSVFRWKSGASSLVSTVQEVAPPTRVVWTGKSWGIAGVHVWELHAAGDGTVVRTSESFNGWLVWLFRGFFTRLLDRALDDVLRMLKSAAEDPGLVRPR